MTDVKAILCCGSTENLCREISCKVEETDNGICFTVTSNDPEQVKMLKAKIKSCCSQDDKLSNC
jgi:hypothetical protein